MYPEENVCVIFKDISYGKVPNEGNLHTNMNDSLKYFFKKAINKNGLEICGMRMVYLDKGQMELYEHLFNEKFASDITTQSLLAFFIRGIDAISKVEKIVGHFNPETARACNEKSVRSFFGQDKD